MSNQIKIIWIDIGTHYGQEYQSIFSNNLYFYWKIFRRFIGSKLLKRGNFLKLTDLFKIHSCRKYLKNNKEFESGLFLVNELKGLCIRRLQFSEFKDTFQIISLPDNKEYSRQTFPAFDNDGNPRVLGKVIWKSGFTAPKELSNLFK